MTEAASLQLLVLDAMPRQRGQIHGETLAGRIHTHLERWLHFLGEETGLEPRRYLRQFLADTDFIPAAEKWTPDLLEELRGIAEGSRADFDLIFARMLSDEEPWYRLGVKFGDGVFGEHCSALGVHEPGQPHPIIAQNMDTAFVMDGSQVVLHIKQPGSPVEALVFTAAGKISLCGLNNFGVGICCNTLLQLDYRTDGLAEDFVVRGVLQQRSLADALAFMRRIEHASGQNYIIGGREGIVDLECSAHKVVEQRPRPQANRLYHTNHPLANDDQAIFRRRLERHGEANRRQLASSTTTYDRYATLQAKAGDFSAGLTLERIKEILCTHEGGAPICIDRGAGKLVTLGSLIMELGERPLLHAAGGPPCSTPYQVFSFSAFDTGDHS